MTSLQRHRAMIAGQKVDFVPRLPILMQFASEFIGADYSNFASDYRVLVAANRKCAEYFGIDQMNTMSDPYRETQGFGAKIIYDKNAIPRCESHPLQEAIEPARLPRPDPLTSERMRDRIEAIKLYRQQVCDAASIMGWVEGPAAEAADLRNLMNFMMDLVDDETQSGELMDRCVTTAIDFARAQIEAGADTIGIGDAIASQVSPDVYEHLIQPREKQLVKALKDMGAIVRLHICGNITHLLPGIADLGVDILDVDHMANIAEARRVVGRRVTLAGNIDPVSGVMRGNPDTIRRTIRRHYELVGNPFMVNAGCEIPPSTPKENLLAMCEPIAYCP